MAAPPDTSATSLRPVTKGSLTLAGTGSPAHRGVLVTEEELLPALAPQDLAGHGLGQLLHQDDAARVLVGGHPLLAVRDELLRGHRRPGLEAHERLDRLPALLV